jgi:hypothetical protein
MGLGSHGMRDTVLYCNKVLYGTASPLVEVIFWWDVANVLVRLPDA